MQQIKEYLIRLYPSGKFFFGGEGGFGPGGNENFIVYSRPYPQQTTLLGMLRMLVLEVYDCLAEPGNGGKLPEEAADHIGECSFNAHEPDKKQSFGKIDGLSHVFLQKGGETFHTAPLDRDFPFYEAVKDSCWISNGRKRPFAPMVKHFDPKKGLDEKLVSEQGSLLGMEDVFVVHSLTGITKKIEREEDEQGFYRQVFFGLQKGFSFSFIARLDEGTAVRIMKRLQANSLLCLGGERSVFAMEMEALPAGSVFPSGHPVYDVAAATGPVKVVLLSDAYVEGDIYPHCAFAVSSTVEFRQLRAHVKKTDNYFRRDKGISDQRQLRKSNKFNLIGRGSVFYLEDAAQLEALKKVLLQPEAFRQIGYNAFQVIEATGDVNIVKL